VPALSSSRISAALERLSRLPASDRALLSGQCPGLAEYLEGVPDPRNRRGVRHGLTSLLMAAVAAVLAGTWPALAQATRAATRVSKV
jgi:DDE_Tnp_1-associated